MVAERTFPTQRRAIAILDRGDGAVVGLIDPMTSEQRLPRGIGGGEWSPVDLVGHLASWERHALEALDAWNAGERAPIDMALAERGVRGVNADTLAAVALLTPPKVLRDAHRVHARLVEAIRDLSRDAWEHPPLSRGRPLGLRLGSILGGPSGPFRHADAHLRDLRAFVRASRVS